MVKFVLTGSTGELGSSVLRHLFGLGVNPKEIILSVYNPKDPDPELAKIVFDVRHGDYKRQETLEKAFQVAEILFLVSSTTMIHEKRTEEHRNAIDAAKNVGIKHILYTSLACGDTRETQIMIAPLDMEDLIKASGLKYTIIREGIYSEMFQSFIGCCDAWTTTEIVVPADGGISFAGRDDLGEGTAKILASANKYENKTIFLTGSKAYTLKEIALFVSKILGCNIPLRFVSSEEYTNQYLNGKDEYWIRLWATTYPALQRGELGRVYSTLENLSGRKPKSLEQTIKEILTDKQTGEKESKAHNKYWQASTFNNK
ncbi:unnamed protein product [Rotaria sp. Silwood1]|nr:unnamed protein product [Rotaria sp. Silwood1]CAF1456876.1 unnamed protein product [Rotaria sp. Silwood1]CAF3546280.1 unnamed protein product [Rotaria sp. Silwood1]CAF3605547.1 unnamed protein product [Rotaria sp. Silwood1]CAF3631622.1 unnamed protein product [Rotaria sp. Silwood1]